MVLEKLKRDKEKEDTKVVMIDKSIITPEMCEEIQGEWDADKEVCVVEEKKYKDAVIFKKLPFKKISKKSDKLEESYE